MTTAIMRARGGRVSDAPVLDFTPQAPSRTLNAAANTEDIVSSMRANMVQAQPSGGAIVPGADTLSSGITIANSVAGLKGDKAPIDPMFGTGAAFLGATSADQRADIALRTGVNQVIPGAGTVIGGIKGITSGDTASQIDGAVNIAGALGYIDPAFLAANALAGALGIDLGSAVASAGRGIDDAVHGIFSGIADIFGW